LLAVFAATLATLLVPILFSLQAIDYGDIPLGSRKAHTRYWGGGGVCGAPAFLPLPPCLTGPTVCFPPQGAVLRVPGGSALQGLLDISMCR
jgi:hypothetical protein